MSRLKLTLFGRIRVAPEDVAGEIKMPRSVQGLLAYLLLFRYRLHPREVLAGLFWHEATEERARSCLSTALWRLRTILEPAGVPKGSYLITTTSGEVGFNQASNYWLDAAVFEETVNRILAKTGPVLDDEDARHLAACQQLYTGDLLEGFYDDWALRERERLRLLNLKALIRLMRHNGHLQAWDDAVAWGQQVLRQEPLLEEIHRDLMRYYVAKGQRTLALRQYQQCCRILKEELGIPPLEETQALFLQIRREGENRAGPSGLARIQETDTLAAGNPPEQNLRLLHQVMQSFEKIFDHIDQASKILEQLLKNQTSRKIS